MRTGKVTLQRLWWDIATRKIIQAGLADAARAYAGDVSNLERLPIRGPFDLALDIGCFHNLDADARQRYAAGVQVRVRPGGLYMLYAFGPTCRGGRQVGLAETEARELFCPAFEILKVDQGRDRGGIGSAWYTLRKT